jgi:F-type H+-transporting ATPase subunit b
MNEFIETFHIDWKIMIAQVINFGLVFLALYLLAAKPLKKLIQERGEEISKGLTDAKLNAETLKNTKEEYNAMLISARNEANTILQNTKKESSVKKTEMLEQARMEVATMIENGKKSLEAEKIKMVAEAKKEIVSLVVQTTEKLIESKVDGAYNEKVLKELNNL